MPSIYKITNLKNGKSYVGYTSRDNVQERITEHCGCDTGHPETKPVPLVKTIRKIVKQAREKKKYK